MRYIAKLMILECNFLTYYHIGTKKDRVRLEKDSMISKKQQKLIERQKISC